MQILLAKPRGFCAGVNRAINIVNRALTLYGAPVYVYHEIVHNSYVIDDLRQRGVIFIEQITEVPDGAVLIFSAHGVAKEICYAVKQRNTIKLFDATCPLVTKIHMEVARASRNGKEVILIGYAGHPEIEGTIGQYDNPSGGIYLVESPKDVWKLQVKNKNNLHLVTQTTLSIDKVVCVTNELNKRFPNITKSRKDNICYATTNRQQAVLELIDIVDIVLVVGSRHSSNSNRLLEVAQKYGKPGYLIESIDDIQIIWFKNIEIIGLTAGASTPDILVFRIIEYLKKIGVNEISELISCEENIIFEIPKKLRI